MKSWFDPQYEHHNDFETLLILFALPSAYGLERHVLLILQTDIHLILYSNRLFKENKFARSHLLCLIAQKLAESRIVVQAERKHALAGLRTTRYTTEVYVNNTGLTKIVGA